MVLIVAVVLAALGRVAMVRGGPRTAAAGDGGAGSARPSWRVCVGPSDVSVLVRVEHCDGGADRSHRRHRRVDPARAQHQPRTLRTNPVRVLIRSAFWVDGYLLLVWLVLFALVLAPVERWLGTVRWLVVFVAGQVGATLATAAGLWLAIRWGSGPSSLSDVVDVGVSLGFAALAAVFTYRLPRPGRWYWAGGLLVAAGGAAIVGGTFTDFGHRAAVMIGFAMYPITRSANVRGRPGGGEPRRQRHVGVGRRRAHGRVDLRRPAGSRDQPVLPDSPVRWRAAFGVGPADGRAPRNRLSMTWSAVAQRWARTRQSRAGRSAPATGRATVSARSMVRSIPAAARSASTASGV